MTAARRNGRLVGVAVLVIALVLVLLVAWFRHTFHRVEKTLYLPPTGEAAYNPLYALAKTLEADGVKVNARQRLLLDDNALAPTDTLLLFNAPRTLSPPDAERLLDWVEGGGHLLVRTPLYSPGEDVAGPDAPQVPLLDRLSAWLVEESPGCVDFQVEGEDHHVEFCTGRRFAFEGEVPELAWGDLQAGYVYARLARGRGHVDLLADFDFMTNTASRPLARQAMDELGLGDIPVCGLAKRLEEVWLPDEEDPVIFSRTSEGLYLLQRLRDEAHRMLPVDLRDDTVACRLHLQPPAVRQFVRAADCLGLVVPDAECRTRLGRHFHAGDRHVVVDGIVARLRAGTGREQQQGCGKCQGKRTHDRSFGNVMDRMPRCGLRRQRQFSLGRRPPPTRPMKAASRNSLDLTKMRSKRNDTQPAMTGRFPYRDARRGNGICTSLPHAE